MATYALRGITLDHIIGAAKSDRLSLANNNAFGLTAGIMTRTLARTVDMIGVDPLAIGSDLCQDQPDSVVRWMRNGRWTRGVDFGEGSTEVPSFPAMSTWFQDNRHFGSIAEGLQVMGMGMGQTEISGVMGGNWFKFFAASFGAEDTKARKAAQ